MVDMRISDNVVWAKHLRDDARLFRRVKELEQNAPIILRIDGNLLLFRKMRDGKDGRRTQGLRPDATARDRWEAMQTRRGEFVKVALVEEGQKAPDPYLLAITPFLAEEWLSPEDCAAFDDL